ncbi:hypothetical protein Tco_0036183, partial [Tanacetum coccineum]
MTVAAAAAKLHEFRQWWQQPGHEITRTEAWVRTTKDSNGARNNNGIGLLYESSMIR